MMDNSLMMCDSCKLSVPANEVKYELKNESSRWVLCPSCRDRSTRKKIKGIIKEAEKIPEIKKPKLNKQASFEKTTYFCARCRYKFQHDDFSENHLRCPYCSKADEVKQYNVLSAERLVRETKE